MSVQSQSGLLGVCCGLTVACVSMRTGHVVRQQRPDDARFLQWCMLHGLPAIDAMYRPMPAESLLAGGVLQEQLSCWSSNAKPRSARSLAQELPYAYCVGCRCLPLAPVASLGTRCTASCPRSLVYHRLDPAPSDGRKDRPVEERRRAANVTTSMQVHGCVCTAMVTHALHF